MGMALLYLISLVSSVVEELTKKLNKVIKVIKNFLKLLYRTIKKFRKAAGRRAKKTIRKQIKKLKSFYYRESFQSFLSTFVLSIYAVLHEYIEDNIDLSSDAKYYISLVLMVVIIWLYHVVFRIKPFSKNKKENVKTMAFYSLATSGMIVLIGVLFEAVAPIFGFTVTMKFAIKLIGGAIVVNFIQNIFINPWIKRLAKEAENKS